MVGRCLLSKDEETGERSMVVVEGPVSVECHGQKGRSDQSETIELGTLEASLYYCQTL